MMMDIDGAAKALTAFVETIEATGGVRYCEDGIFEPVGDAAWTDLADAYMLACKALGRKPKITNENLKG